MKEVVFICLCVIICVIASNASSTGKAAIWSSSPSVVASASSIEYSTKAIISTELPNYVHEKLNNNIKYVALLSSADSNKSIFDHTFMVNSIQSSNNAIVFPNIYNPSTLSVSLPNVFSSSSSSSDVEFIDLHNFEKLVRNDQSATVIGTTVTATDKIYHIKLSGHESEALIFNELAMGTAIPGVMFVAYDEPTAEAIAPADSGNYRRVLAVSSDRSDGIYYKPEGAEYSIYYASTYLYITPDIFTGAMIGIFFVFIALIGYSCLNGIQGNDMYASKVCPVGKEV